MYLEAVRGSAAYQQTETPRDHYIAPGRRAGQRGHPNRQTERPLALDLPSSATYSVSAVGSSHLMNETPMPKKDRPYRSNDEIADRLATCLPYRHAQ